MKRAVFVALLLLGSVGMATGGSMFFFFVGSAGGPPPAPCGTGVIDLSAGCSLPIALGLVP